MKMEAPKYIDTLRTLTAVTDFFIIMTVIAIPPMNIATSKYCSLPTVRQTAFSARTISQYARNMVDCGRLRHREGVCANC